MDRPRGDFDDFVHGSPHHLHESHILIVCGGKKYRFRLSAIQFQLPGLFKIIRRDRGHRSRGRKRHFDIVDVINSRFNPSKDISYLIECAQTILDHVHQSDAGTVPIALFRRLDSYLGRRDTHDGRVHDWKALVKRFVVLGKLLDPRVLGCGRELFDDFSGWFMREARAIVRSMPMDAVLDLIHAFERTRRSFTHVLEALIDVLDSRRTAELLHFESKPTYLRSFISSSTVHRIRKMIYSNSEGVRTKDRRRLPGSFDWSLDALVRPYLPSPRGSSKDLVPRVHETELVTGDEISRGVLHDIVEFEPERILVQDPHVGPHHTSGRSRIGHRRAHPGVGGAFLDFDDEDFFDTDSEDDYDDYVPSPYEYEDQGVGGIVVPPSLGLPYREPDRFGDGFFDIYDDVVHAPRPVPVMV